MRPMITDRGPSEWASGFLGKSFFDFSVAEDVPIVNYIHVQFNVMILGHNWLGTKKVTYWA